MVKRLGVLSRLLTPSNPATFCSTIVPDTGAFKSSSGLGCAGSAPRTCTRCCGSFYVYFGFVFDVLRGFEIFGCDRAAVVQHLSAIESFVREHFVGSCFLIVGHRGGEVGAGNDQQRLAFLHGVAEFDFEIDDAAAAERRHVDGAIHIRRNGSVGGDLRGQLTGLGLRGFE